MSISVTIPGFGPATIRSIGDAAVYEVELFNERVKTTQIESLTRGESLAKALQESPSTWLQIGQLLRRIHMPVTGSVNTYMIGLVGEVLGLVKSLDTVLKENGIPAGTVYASFEKRADARAIRSLGLARIHGGLSFNNLLFDGASLEGFADGETSRVGSPYEDIAMTFATAPNPVHYSELADGYDRPLHKDNLIAFCIVACLRAILEAENERRSDLIGKLRSYVES